MVFVFYLRSLYRVKMYFSKSGLQLLSHKVTCVCVFVCVSSPLKHWPLELRNSCQSSLFSSSIRATCAVMWSWWVYGSSCASATVLKCWCLSANKIYECFSCQCRKFPCITVYQMSTVSWVHNWWKPDYNLSGILLILQFASYIIVVVFATACVSCWKTRWEFTKDVDSVTTTPPVTSGNNSETT